MAHRKTRLKLKHQDLAINTDVRTGKLSPDSIQDRPEIVRRDGQSGSLVVRQTYEKESGDALEEGYGYRWINEDGAEVPTEDLELFAVEDGEEVAFEKHEPTVGGDRVLTADTWIPVADLDGYLVERIYEMWGDTEADEAQLYELAVHVRDFDEAPVVPFVLQPAMFKTWGIITPFFYDDTFSLIVRVTDQKIEPEHQMPVPSDDAREKALEPDPDKRTLEQESPFS